MTIVNLTQKINIATNAVYAKSFFSRLKGLIGKNCFSSGEALVIPGCQAIHMFFMKFSIDVIFIDKEKRVVGLVQAIKPFCLSPLFWKASLAIEIPQGTINQTKTKLRDLILIE